MSKAFSLAGLRLGWVAGPQELVAKLMVQRDYSTISVGMIDDLLSAYALEHADAILARNRALVRGNHKTLSDWIDHEPHISWVEPAGGTTAFLKYDLDVTKRLNFNMIRKHVKVEPARWYRHCDEMGFLVWQDMPSADNKTDESKTQFDVEWKAIIDALRNHPSVVMWVPFNEGWGQFDSLAVARRLRELDPTRLIVDNSACQGNFHVAGDIGSILASGVSPPSRSSMGAAESSVR